MPSDYSVSLMHLLNYQFVRVAFHELNSNCILLYDLFSMLSIIQTEKEEESLVVIYADDGTFSCIISRGQQKLWFTAKSVLVQLKWIMKSFQSIYKNNCADGKPGSKILVFWNWLCT